MSSTVLDQLVVGARARSRRAARILPLRELRRRIRTLPPARRFEAALRYGDRLGLIAEIKRSSPSTGRLRWHVEGPAGAARLAVDYARAGASCLSVLTEPELFGGTDDDLGAAATAGLPVLRKDFVTNQYQVLQARLLGADAVLLIARLLSDDGIRRLIEVAAEADMDALVEIHDSEELRRALAADATLIGVNARDLQTLRVDVAASLPLLSAARAAGATVVAESGLSSAADLQRAAEAGAHGALIGTSLLVAARPGDAARKLVRAAPRIDAPLATVPARTSRVSVKVCGLRTEAGVRAATAAGADLAGFVVAPGTRRRVAPARVRALVRGLKGPRPVLVFRRTRRAQLDRAVSESGVKDVQLSGLTRAPTWLPAASMALGIVIGVVHADGQVRDTLMRAEAWLRAGATDLLLDGSSRQDGGGSAGRAPLLLARRLGRLLPIGIAGGLTPGIVAAAVARARPAFVDASSGIERRGITNPRRLARFVHEARRDVTGADRVDRRGRFNRFGGRYVAETLVPALEQLEAGWHEARRDASFTRELAALQRDFIGRPTALFEVPAPVLAAVGASRRRLLLKREDLAHTGAHKINNAIGQVLLAKRMGRQRIIAETGAGQHGVATAAACAYFGLECAVYMGTTDIDRQAPNVARMRLLGAEVRPVSTGNGTLRDALNEALRDWAASVGTTAYVLGSAAGPHPYPSMVAELQSVIGREAREQCLDQVGALPQVALACVGGGSNAMGLFMAFLDTPTRLIGVEAGGRGDGLGDNAASLGLGRPGVLHGAFTMITQTDDGQVVEPHSISAGLDYPAVGPQLAALAESGRMEVERATDDEALDALTWLSRSCGIVPALEPAHAVAAALRLLPTLADRSICLVNLSGRGDKDLDIVTRERHSELVAAGSAS